ncbi:putative small signal peptide [Cryptosporidium bovis]|uniref:putative small signal peptide n=1 Tax=Cryptosporidium bovis TaxID=310047 RepID=UPI003519F5ED|nr:putative small signal peptide [Cryptosporidium bovis]
MKGRNIKNGHLNEEKYNSFQEYQQKYRSKKLNKYTKINKKNRENKVEITKYYKKCILIIVILFGVFVFFVTLYLYSFFYGSIPWLESGSWPIIPNQKEYSLQKMLKGSKSLNSIDKLNLISPFFNGTLLKTKIEKYGNPVFESPDENGNCKHTIVYDNTIPPGGWIIYSSCQRSLENPQGYSSIRALGYPAYGNSVKAHTPLEIDEWYHGFYTHIQVPIIVLDGR